jgi:hypothetical protein
MAPGDPRTFFTVVLALGLASGLTGAVFLILGLFRLLSLGKHSTR